MLTYQLLTGHFPFWENVQNLTLQQARTVFESCLLLFSDFRLTHDSTGQSMGQAVVTTEPL